MESAGSAKLSPSLPARAVGPAKAVVRRYGHR